MKTLPTLTLAAVMAAAGFCILWQADRLGAQPQPEKAAPAEGKPSDSKPEEKSGEAQAEAALQQLRSSIARIKGYKTISSKIQVNLNLESYGFAGEGRYVVGPDNKMLYEIVVQLPNTTGRLFEVCDGEILITRHEILPKKSLKKEEKKDKDEKKTAKDKEKPDLLRPEISVTRRNVKTILEHLSRQPDPNLHQQWIVNLGLGGLPALLTSIDKAMVFRTLKSDTIRGHKVNVIEGRWTTAQKSVWLQQGQTELPPIVPELIRISFDQETQIPLRIVFLKPIPDTKGLRTMVAVDFVDVVVNQPVDDALFVYKEDLDNPPQELTTEIVTQIEQAAAANAQGQPEQQPAGTNR